MKLTEPQITQCPGMEGNWLVAEDFRYQGHGIDITIPKGFVTDLASIPRALWRLIAPFELSLTAPIVHDLLYRSSGTWGGLALTREQVDGLFRDIMADEGVSWWRRTLAYRGVRLCGGGSWGAAKVEVVRIEGETA